MIPRVEPESMLFRIMLYRGRENLSIVSATVRLPIRSSAARIVGDEITVDVIANAARPTLSANTSPTTRNTVKPLQVAR